MADNTSLDAEMVTQHSLTVEVRQRLVRIRERLQELELRRLEVSGDRGSVAAPGRREARDRAQRAVDDAARHAPRARQRVRSTYLTAARIHEYAAARCEARADTDPADAGYYKQRAAVHRQAAAESRLKAKEPALDEATDLISS